MVAPLRWLFVSEPAGPENPRVFPGRWRADPSDRDGSVIARSGPGDVGSFDRESQFLLLEHVTWQPEYRAAGLGVGRGRDMGWGKATKGRHENAAGERYEVLFAIVRPLTEWLTWCHSPKSLAKLAKPWLIVQP